MPTTDPVVLAAGERCWYADAERRPELSRCPPVCIGECTHAERHSDGIQRFYCPDHAYWRTQEIGPGGLRRLAVGELS